MAIRIHALPLLVVTAIITACGAKAPALVAPTSTSTGANTNPNVTSPYDPNARTTTTGGSLDQTPAAAECTKDNCPKADPAVRAVDPAAFEGKTLVGRVDEAVSWELEGVDNNSPTRRIGILLNQIPPDSKVEPEKEVAEKVSIDWTPETALKSTKKMEIYLRDMDRCEAEEKKSYCKEYKYKKKYDTKKTYAWKIKAKDDTSTATDEPDDVATIVNGTGTGTGQDCSKDGDVLGTVVGLLGNGAGGGLGALGGLIGAFTKKDGC